MRKAYKYSLLGILIIALTGAGLFGALYIKNNYRNEILASPIVHRVIPLYRSLRKLPDIVFMPWSAFAKSNLETYELTISPQNIERMNSVLPETPFNSGSDNGSKLWVSGYFRAPGYEDNIKVRYRGDLASHWNAYQKSYLIKFPKDHLFNGMREVILIIPSRRMYLGMSLNDYRAEKLGLIHPSEKFVRMELNGADMGVLYTFEGWSQEWIEKLPISALSTLYKVGGEVAPYRERWGSWNYDDPVDLAPLDALTEIVEHASDEEFKKLLPLIIDIEDWYNWDIMQILSSGYHIGGDTFGDNNVVLIFERSEGRFKPVPYNTVIYTPSYREKIGQPGMRGYPPKLTQRIFSIPEFKARRDELWKEYVAKQKEDDMEFLENWKNTYNREFLLDNAKNANHFMYLSEIKENVESAEWHFEDPYHIVDKTYDVVFEEKEKLDFPEAFKHLYSASQNPTEAARQHSSIIETKDGLLIPAGNHWFDKTIIIPASTSLTIAPGATLHMKEDASFISYSPIKAEGTESRPITITGYGPEKSWGVFAVLNTETATSTIKYVQANNGGEDTINGAYVSGTLAFHNSNVVIQNTTVRNAKGDDGINVKGSFVVMTDNTLIENSSDGVDLDYIEPASVIEGNEFLSNKGDALDISWSDIKIKENTVTNCGDKGISVGESSKPTIINNQISGCQIGIAIKDSSHAIITGNTISTTTTAISAYQKKPYFGGGTVELENNILTNNKNYFYTDSLSEIVQ